MSERRTLIKYLFWHTGVLKRRFVLGDGLESVQTTENGKIWTSFFDEGIWGHDINSVPIGKTLSSYTP